MNEQELIAWINTWREPRDGWGYPNRMLYMLADLLGDFELDDLSPAVLQALSSPIPELPPPASVWEKLRITGRGATAVIIEGLKSGTITAMADRDDPRHRWTNGKLTSCAGTVKVCFP